MTFESFVTQIARKKNLHNVCWTTVFCWMTFREAGLGKGKDCFPRCPTLYPHSQSQQWAHYKFFLLSRSSRPSRLKQDRGLCHNTASAPGHKYRVDLGSRHYCGILIAPINRIYKQMWHTKIVHLRYDKAQFLFFLNN